MAALRSAAEEIRPVAIDDGRSCGLSPTIVLAAANRVRGPGSGRPALGCAHGRWRCTSAIEQGTVKSEEGMRCVSWSWSRRRGRARPGSCPLPGSWKRWGGSTRRRDPCPPFPEYRPDDADGRRGRARSSASGARACKCRLCRDGQTHSAPSDPRPIDLVRMEATRRIVLAGARPGLSALVTLCGERPRVPAAGIRPAVSALETGREEDATCRRPGAVAVRWRRAPCPTATALHRSVPTRRAVSCL